LFLIFVYLLLFYEGVMNLYHGIAESRSDAVRNGSLCLGGWLLLTVLVSSGYYYSNKQEKKEPEQEHKVNVIDPQKSSLKKKNQS
jgi:hypothetical protein